MAKTYAMKLTVLLLILSFPCFAQKVFIEDGKLNGVLPINAAGSTEYVRVNDAQGVTKDALFKRARKWFVKTYNSPKDVLQLNDPSTGELSGNGIFLATPMIGRIRYETTVNHTLAVEVKDNRYRVTLTSLTIGPDRTSIKDHELPYIVTTKTHYTAFYKEIDQRANALLASLENAMATAGDF